MPNPAKKQKGPVANHCGRAFKIRSAKSASYLILVFLRLDFTLALAGTTTVLAGLGLAVVVVDSMVVEAGAVCIGLVVVVVVAGIVVVAGVVVV